MPDLLEVARAALMEVGCDAECAFIQDGRVCFYTWGGDPTLLMRAGYLARLAVEGPDAPVRCLSCAPSGRHTAPCTPVRDALRGVTCGR